MKYLCSFREERYGYFEVESDHHPTRTEVNDLAKDGRAIEYSDSRLADIQIEQQGNPPKKKTRDEAR